jgi:hypothetical protein
MEEREEELKNKLHLACRQIQDQLIGFETLKEYCDIDEFHINKLNEILLELNFVYDSLLENKNIDKFRLFQNKFKKL